VTVEAVVFDVGETLLDETRAWTAWADALDLTPLTLMAVLGAAIDRGEDHRAPFALLRPDVDLRALVASQTRAGPPIGFEHDDLYPDAVDGLRALVEAGYRVGVAGNQPVATEAVFRGLGVDLAFVASSGSLGAAKPDPAFFAAIVDRLGLPPAAIAYVGDRVDNDIRPAAAAGMVAVFLRRGPWAWIQAGRDDPPEAAVIIDTLTELPEALRRLA
jgi:FMN phosphatase YigB (HAD superfamily)